MSVGVLERKLAKHIFDQPDADGMPEDVLMDPYPEPQFMELSRPVRCNTADCRRRVAENIAAKMHPEKAREYEFYTRNQEFSD